MDLKEKYKAEVQKHDNEGMLHILVENFIQNFDFQSLNDLGVLLCDSDCNGVCISLSEKSSFELGKKMIKTSYFSHPDLKNAYALQMACLEKGCDYETVCSMENSAKKLNHCFILNNIACAKYYSGFLKDALNLQKAALNASGLENDNINQTALKYNLFLYELFSNITPKFKEQKAEFLTLLTSDRIFDYDAAMILAVYLDDREFVQKNFQFYRKTFESLPSQELLIENYLYASEIPSISEISKILKPLTVYESNFYLTAEG